MARSPMHAKDLADHVRVDQPTGEDVAAVSNKG